MGAGLVSDELAVERPYRIAVIGAARPTDADYETARELGEALAGAGAIVVCGGRGGVMEAAARGAAAVGGLTVGILPGRDAASANPWIRIPLPTGMGEARNALVVGAAEAVVSVGGAWGTLSELALASTMGLAVGTLGEPPAKGLGLPALDGPTEAAMWAVDRARAFRGAG